MSTIRKKNYKDKTKYQALVRVSGTPTISKTFNLKSHALQWAKEAKDIESILRIIIILTFIDDRC